MLRLLLIEFVHSLCCRVAILPGMKLTQKLLKTDNLIGKTLHFLFFEVFKVLFISIQASTSLYIYK